MERNIRKKRFFFGVGLESLDLTKAEMQRLIFIVYSMEEKLYDIWDIEKLMASLMVKLMIIITLINCIITFRRSQILLQDFEILR